MPKVSQGCIIPIGKKQKGEDPLGYELGDAPIDEARALEMLTVGWARLGVEIDAYLSDSFGRRNLHLSRIEVEKGRRLQGLGTKAMEDLTEYADRYSLLMTLSPATDFGGTSVERLKRFYRRFGFVSNKGRHKDFTLRDSMYRRPSQERRT
jgi:GNAT superfamily N-acetyltransferase